MSDFDFDPYDPASFEDPYPSYVTMRNEHPVYRREIPNYQVFPHYWMLSRAEDVNNAASDPKTFSSAKGTLIDIDVSLLPLNLFHMDPPRHDVLRRTLSRVLTPSRVAALEPFIREHVTSLIDEFKGDGRVDATTGFAQLVPSVVVCQLMGLPVEDQQLFLKWNLDTLGGADFTSPAALQAYGQMEEYWKQLVVGKQGNWTDDLVSHIFRAVEEDKADLTDEEIWGFCSLLHDASQNTTLNMIANGVIVLGRHPEARHRLAEDPSLWGNALEELLRYVSPVQGLARDDDAATSSSTTPPSPRATRSCCSMGRPTTTSASSTIPRPSTSTGRSTGSGRSVRASTSAWVLRSRSWRPASRCSAWSRRSATGRSTKQASSARSSCRRAASRTRRSASQR